MEKLFQEIIKGIKNRILITPIVESIVPLIFLVIYYLYSKLFINNPLFSGVMISWFFAVLSTAIILIFTNSGRRDQYEIIFKKYEKLLMSVSVAVLFYISINISSNALTGKGVPILSEPYKIGSISPISLQDVFLIFLVIIIIIIVFIVMPRLNLSSSWIHIKVVLMILAIMILFLLLFLHFAEPIDSKENMENSSNQVNDEQKNLFGYLAIISSIVYVLIWSKMPTEAKGSDWNDLRNYFCLIPAFVVASLVLIRHPFVVYPNLAGHAIVGLLFISGFTTLVSLSLITLENPKISSSIWGLAIFLSLTAISFFSQLFLWLEEYIHPDNIETFRKILMFSIAIILIILQYSFQYEKMFKYRFTEWWRRKFKPWAIAISILIILVVGIIDQNHRLWGISIKLILIFIALIIMFFLPWIFKLVLYLKKNGIKGLKKHMNPPDYQGIVLVKTEMGRDIFKNVVHKIEHIEGVYQTMVVTGEYDLCLIVEGDGYDNFVSRILDINKMEGVARTTTLTDIREYFDKGER